MATTTAEEGFEKKKRSRELQLQKLQNNSLFFMRLWQMGSNPSKSEVVSIRIPSAQQKKRISDLESCDKTSSKSQPEVDQLMSELTALRKELSKERASHLKEQQTAIAYQELLDERERDILHLREELESLQNQCTASSSTTVGNRMDEEEQDKLDRTVHAKDQYIKSLEEELSGMKEETTKVTERYQKKLKKVRALSSKSRQDSSLKLFELKDENSKLMEQNTKLQERIERMSVDSGEFSRQSSAASRRSILSRDHDVTSRDNDVTEEVDPHDDPRMKLVLDLSQQVAALDSENHQLKQELRHSKKIAEKVERARLKAKRKSQNSTSNGVINDVMVVDSNTNWSAIDAARACLEVGDRT